ncbi:MAG TPA: zf-HC2 domain-containing protein [Myxococcus sp.]|jgi:hypothetical protein|nr:zf-HC2 domain-containing protein [Myxococcus sp.]
MKPQSLHAQEDRLLDFAYGELPNPEARLVEAHLQGCARCTQALDDIRGVRATMSQLSHEPAPDAGLESLLAYAHQAARRAAAGPEPKPSRWRRWLLPVMGVASVATLGIFSIQAMEPKLTSPNLSVAVQEKAQERAKAEYGAAEPAAPVAQALPAAAEPLPQAELLDKAPGEAKQEPERAPDWNNAGSGGALDPRVTRASEAKGKWDGSGVGTKERASGPSKRKSAPMKPAPADAFSRDEAPQGAAEAREQEPLAKKAPARREALRLGGLESDTASRAASDDEALEEAPAEAEVQAGSPPPASPAAVASAPMPSSMPTRAPRAGAAAKDAEDLDAYAAPTSLPPPPAKASASAMPKAVASSPAELSRQAQDAYRAGNRAREASLLRAALATGVSGSERLNLLNRLCDAELELGRRSDGLAACLQVVDEAPDSSAAQTARRRLSRESVELRTPEKSAVPAK